jgi:hypothetical protein
LPGFFNSQIAHEEPPLPGLFRQGSGATKANLE